MLTDDQGYGDLSCHGNPVLKTPHLDRLWAESIRLTDFHVAPMCTPTRGQLLTGRDCLANGAMNVSSGRTLLRRELPTMANLFAAAGYRCGQFGKWHLGDKELYDLRADFGQQTNVIAHHADLVARVRSHYEQWWARVVPSVNQHSALIIGSDAENPMQLSPADWEDSFLDQGAQVRSGLQRNGACNVVVDRTGEYEFELRRWPREADAAIAAGLPRSKYTDGEFPAGVALSIAQARVQIADYDQSRSVAATDKAVTFTARLPAGRTQLRTSFYGADGQELCGAYYVYVLRR